MTNKFTHQRRRASSHPHPVYIWATVFSCLSRLLPILAHTPAILDACYEVPVMVTGNVWVFFSPSHPVLHKLQISCVTPVLMFYRLIITDYCCIS